MVDPHLYKKNTQKNTKILNARFLKKKTNKNQPAIHSKKNTIASSKKKWDIFRMHVFSYVKRSEKEKHILISVASALILITSLLFEHVFDFPVCKLCMYERYPYMAAVGFGLFGFFFHNNGSALHFARSLLIFTFFASFSLSAYHVMIEYGVIPLPDFCKTDLLKVTNFAELKAQIMSTRKLVPCNAASVKILFLTLAEWNTIVSFLLLASAWLLKKR